MHRKCLHTLKVTVLLVFLCSPAYANTPELDQAMNYINQEQFEEAAAIYNSLLGNQPDKETEILALGGLIVIDIYQGNTEIAAASAEQLIADNPANEIVSSAVFDIAYAFLNVSEPNESRQYYLYIVDNWPECEDAIPAEFGLIRCDISSGNIQEADTALDNLILNLPAGEDFSAQLTDTAGAYQEAGLYDSARALYEKVLNTWPDSEDAVLAATYVIASDIRLGNVQDANAVIENLLGECYKYKDDPNLLIEISEAFQDIDNYASAKQVYQLMLDSWPDSEDTVTGLPLQERFQVHVNLVESNIRLADANSYSSSYSKLIEDFNDYQGLPKGLHEIGVVHLDMQQDDKAAEVFQLASDKALILGGENALFQNRLSLILKYICTEEDTQAQAVIDTFITDFKAHPEFSEAVAGIIEGYFMKVFYARGTAEQRDWVQPVVTWEKALAAVEDFYCDAPAAYYFVGCCYYRLFDYESALIYYQTIPFNWPDSSWTDDARAMIKKVQEKLPEESS